LFSLFISILFSTICNFKLQKPWEECKKLYEWAYSLDTSRPDSLYFIGIHYYMDGPDQNKKVAYEYFKTCFQLGYPIHAQYSLKPSLSFYYLPKLLAQMCYEYNDFLLGLEVTTYFFEKNQKTYVKIPDLTEFKSENQRETDRPKRSIKPSSIRPASASRRILARRVMYRA
jgi:hypothetical protein